MRIQVKITAIAAAFFLFGCSSSDDGGAGGIPEAALLVAPINNSECLTGTSISDTESTVSLQWNTSENAVSYLVFVKNLLTQVTSQYNPGTNVSIDVALLKNTPYSWYIVSKNEAGDSAQSEKWKFYNAGNGVVNYAPFPAESIAPLMSSTISGATVSLQWDGSDIDNDIVEYKVYMDTNANPTTLKTTTALESLQNLPVVSGTAYYWKVVTKDSAGNTSNSAVFQFRVL